MSAQTRLCRLCNGRKRVPNEIAADRHVCRKCRSGQRQEQRRAAGSGRLKTAVAAYKAAVEGACQEQDGNDLLLRDEPRTVIRTPEEYLSAIGMSLECLREDGDSEFVVTRKRLNHWDGKFQVELHLTRRKPMAVTMPALSACQIVLPKPSAAKRAVKDGTHKAIILPDMQIGYRRDLQTGKLQEFHDRDAIDLAIQIVADVKPQVVVLLGDNLDLPDWSDKYARDPEMYFTTEPAVREYAYILGLLRQAAPDAQIVELAGNHVARLQRAVSTYLLAAGGVKNPVSGTPLLHPKSLIDPTDSLGIIWLDYPDGEFWLNPNVRCIHGIYANNQPGATARQYLQTARCSTWYGHIHRYEALAVTHRFSGGQRTYVAESPGCLCHTDGRVPGSSPHSNWQQGISYIEFEPVEDGLYSSQWIPIFGGRAVFQGRRYEGAYDVGALVRATGWETFR